MIQDTLHSRQSLARQKKGFVASFSLTHAPDKRYSIRLSAQRLKVATMNNDDKDAVLDLNFDLTPSWARATPDASAESFKGRHYDEGDRGSSRHNQDRRDSGNRRPMRDQGDRPKGGTDRRPPRRELERKGPPSSMPRPESRGAVVDFAVARPSGDNRPQRRDDFHSRGERPYRQEYQQPMLPLEIRVLPEQKALGAVIRRVQTTHRAFPLRDIASLFLDNPNSCLVRIEPLKDQQLPLFQCKVCGFPALTEEEVRSHLISHHINDFFDTEEVDCDPPTGVFTCVARCTMSGELIGPTNHHSYNAKLQEVLRTKFPNMTEEAYRSRIEIVRDAEVIEQWRQQCTKKKIYRRKGVVTETAPAVPPAEGAEVPAETAVEPPLKAPPLSREVAELVFLREIVPEQLASVKHLVCTVAVALNTSSRPLAGMLRDILNRERRFPASLFFALRGAFRHRKLHLFRVNDAKGPDFVMLKTPVPLDPVHTVKALHDVLMFVTEHPACTKMELVNTLSENDDEKKKEILIQLAWLLEKGHVIEFYNDVLSSPTEYPMFRYLPGEKNYNSGNQRPQAPREQAPRVAPVGAVAPVVAETPVAPEAPQAEVVEEAPTAQKDVPTAEASTPEALTETPPTAEQTTEAQ